jgi:acetyl-CoA carboxylase alpha subunit
VNGAILSLNQDSSFDDDETAVTGTARWGDLPVVVSVDSKDGTELLKRGWDATEEEFQRNLDRVKEALD